MSSELFWQIIALMSFAYTFASLVHVKITIKHELPTNWDIKMNNTNIYKDK